MTPAGVERQLLADTFLEVGPDAATLCGDWTTRDLAAHLVVRERRPDAAPGILVKRLARYTDKVQAAVAASDWEELVDQVRNGPPAWSPTRIDAVDRQVNTTEFFVHHEDVLRAGDTWSVRDLPADLVDDLYSALGRAKLFVRKSPVGIVLQPSDDRPAITAKRADPSVTVTGPVGELIMWVFGRQAHAAVDYDGDPAAIETVKTASFGL